MKNIKKFICPRCGKLTLEKDGKRNKKNNIWLCKKCFAKMSKR